MLESQESIPPYELQLTGRTGLRLVREITREGISLSRSYFDRLESHFSSYRT
jgi:hypothetical protein